MKKLKLVAFVLGFYLVTFKVFAASQAALVTSNSFATQAGAIVLENGGTAADAAIAAAFVSAVVEPSHSGLGGGGIALYYDKAQNEWSVFDYMPMLSEVQAEGLATWDSTPKALKRQTAITRVGTPGFVAGLEKLHQRFGKTPWADLLMDAIHLAEDGFQAEPTVLAAVKQLKPSETENEDFKTNFLAPLAATPPVLKQEALAKTLEQIRSGGAEAFYKGELSQKILKELAQNKSPLTVNDFTYYQVRVGTPTPYYFKDLKLALPLPPSQAGVFLDHLLRAERVKKIPTTDARFPKFLEDETLKFLKSKPQIKDVLPAKSGHATQIVAVDAQGNVMAMVNTLSGLFGSGVYLKESGIILNAAGQDVALFDAKEETEPSSFVEASLKRRTYNWFLPLIVTRAFEETLIITGTGGILIPQNVFEVLQKVYVENENLDKAIKAPKDYTVPSLGKTISEKQEVQTWSQLQVIQIRNDKIKAYADPRGGASLQVVRVKTSKPQTKTSK